MGLLVVIVRGEGITTATTDILDMCSEQFRFETYPNLFNRGPGKAFTNKPKGHAAAPPKIADEMAE